MFFHWVPGCRADKFHLTGKPTKLLKELVQVVPPGARILDPFAESGTTLVAAEDLGRQADGIEWEREYCEITRVRLQPVSSTNRPRLLTPANRSLAT